MASMSDLEQTLRTRFGTAPAEPTDQQLNDIVKYIDRLAGLRQTSDADWERAVQIYCPTFGTHKYAARDTSDLTAILRRIRAAGTP
jgi:hypothetical protein